MRILSIDHGTKRIGLAISDELGIIAQPLEFVPAEPFNKFLERLKEIIEVKQVELLLVGMPRNMDGSYGPAALKGEEFVAVGEGGGGGAFHVGGRRLTSGRGGRVFGAGKMRGGGQEGEAVK